MMTQKQYKKNKNTFVNARIYYIAIQTPMGWLRLKDLQRFNLHEVKKIVIKVKVKTQKQSVNFV